MTVPSALLSHRTDEHLTLEGLKGLADAFEGNISILEPLELIVTAAFSTTGPGNYLREKGQLTL